MSESTICSYSPSTKGIKCNCSIPAAFRTATTRDNPGRRFWGCKFYCSRTQRRGCNFFKWYDEDSTQWQTNIINQLGDEKKWLQDDVLRLKDEVNLLKKDLEFEKEKNIVLEGSYSAMKSECENARSSTEFMRKVFVFAIIIVVVLGMVYT